MADVKRPNLPRLLVTWQARLRLLDWEVTAHYVGPTHEGFAECFGKIYPDTLRKSARMLILDPKRDTHPNVEATVVHELLHLHLWLLTRHFEPGTHEELIEEQAVNAIAAALVAGYAES